jgi:hypothetical protein
LPDVSLADTRPLRISGRIEELPAPGLASGRAPPAQDASWPKLAASRTTTSCSRAGRKISRRILLLDPGLPTVMCAVNHRPASPGAAFFYAIQWWGFALVLLVLYFGLNFRKVT